MSTNISSKPFLVTALLAAITLLSSAEAGAVTAPGVMCAQGVAKVAGSCTKKVIGIEASCYKKTGTACASDDKRLVAAFASAAKASAAKCKTPADITAAGYAPYSAVALGNFVSDSCKWQADLATRHTFGEDGSRYTAADATGKTCLLTAAKAQAKYLNSTIGGLSKCVATGCSFGPAAFSATAAAAVTDLDERCPTFATVIGSTTDAYFAAATAQIPAAVVSPCDPMDTTRCLFPFPNDYFAMDNDLTPTGKRLAFGRSTLPATGGGKSVDPARWNEVDGFSVGPMILFNDVNIDLAVTGAPSLTNIARSLDSDSPAVLIDAETGAKQLFWLERDLRGLTIADQPLIGHVGRNLKNNHRYIVALRNMKNSSGTVLAAPAGFAVYRDDTPTTILPVEARRAHMKEVIDGLFDAGVDTSELYMAWDFTTQSEESTAGRLLTMRDDAFAALGSDAPDFTVTSTIDNPDPRIFRQVNGTFEVPLYLTNNGDPGSTLNVDANGVPTPVAGETFTAHFQCEIPKAATTAGSTPAIPARVSMYGHGLLGSHGEVDAGNIQDFANEHNFIFCATDWTGFSEDDSIFVAGVLTNFSLFPFFIDRQHQGILNMMMLGRLLIHPDGFASDAAFKVGGESMMDTSELFYDGNSQGGILGGVLAAFEQDATRFSLGVPGMNYSTLLNRSTDFVDFNNILSVTYTKSTERNGLLAVAQILWDRTDPSGHVNHVLSDTYDSTPAKKCLYQVAFGDHQVAPLTVEDIARSNGASIHTPVLQPGKVVPDVTPYYDIPPIASYPFDGSAMVVWDAGNPAPPTGNIPPPAITPLDPEWPLLSSCAQGGEGGDPHSCPRKTAAARTQKSEFLKTGGAVVDVCGGLACLVP